MSQRAHVASATIERLSAAGLDMAIISGRRLDETHVTVRPRANESLASVFERLAAALRARGALIVKLDVFGPVAAREEGLRALAAAFGHVNWPVTWVEEDSCEGDTLAGVQALAVSRASVETIAVDGVPVGRVFEDDGVRFCLLGDVRATDPSAPRAQQARETFELMESRLALAGMNMSHVVRTWLYVDEILAWYGDLNTVRTTFFAERQLFDGLVPASTGVNGRNHSGAAMVASVWAAKPIGGKQAFSARAVESPLQCSARDYGSSFSRAVELDYAGHRIVLVSGTASIEPGGKTVHLGDVDKQIALTMDVVAAILESRGYGKGAQGFANVTRAIAYFKRPGDAPALDRWRERAGVAAFPVVVAHNDICRDDLLFEIELDAAIPIEGQ